MTAKCHFDNKTDRSTFNVGRSALALYKELYKNKIAPLMERYFVRQYFDNMSFGDPDENRTRVTAVKGRCLSRLTTGPWKSGYNKFRELFGSLNWWRKWDLNL